MSLDYAFDTDSAADGEAASAPPGRAAADTLVLFVGAGCRPARAEFSTLGRDGVRCVWSADLDQALRMARLARFDALVIDAGALAAREGWALARARAAFGCPLLVVAERSGHVDEVDEIVALELGADAFLARPLAPRRLRAHLAALWRPRSGAVAAPEPDTAPSAQMSGWWLDRVGNRLVGDDRSVTVTELQAALLQCLLAAAGRAVPRAQLRDALPLGREVGARSVDVYMHRLRKRLADAGVRDLVVVCVRGRGYLLRAEAASRQVRSASPMTRIDASMTGALNAA
jgi:two-component system OmpR family response regulator